MIIAVNFSNLSNWKEEAWKYQGFKPPSFPDIFIFTARITLHFRIDFDGGSFIVYAECNERIRMHEDTKRNISRHEAKHSFDGRTIGDSTTRNDCKHHAKYVSTTRTKDSNFVRNLRAWF